MCNFSESIIGDYKVDSQPAHCSFQKEMQSRTQTPLDDHVDFVFFLVFFFFHSYPRCLNSRLLLRKGSLRYFWQGGGGNYGRTLFTTLTQYFFTPSPPSFLFSGPRWHKIARTFLFGGFLGRRTTPISVVTNLSFHRYAIPWRDMGGREVCSFSRFRPLLPPWLKDILFYFSSLVLIDNSDTWQVSSFSSSAELLTSWL